MARTGVFATGFFAADFAVAISGFAGFFAATNGFFAGVLAAVFLAAVFLGADFLTAGRAAAGLDDFFVAGFADFASFFFAEDFAIVLPFTG
jgi:hypothetical protein